MDLSSCSVVYLDNRAREARTFTRDNPPSSSFFGPTTMGAKLSPTEEVEASVNALLTTFSHVFVYTGGENCSACIKSIDHYPGEDTYTLLIIHVPFTEDTHMSDEMDLGPTDAEPLYGAQFLLHIVEELQSQNKSGVVLPIVLGGRHSESGEEPSNTWKDEKRTLGALDVLSSPIDLPLSGVYMQQLLHRAQALYTKPRKGEYDTMTRNLVAKLMLDLCGQTNYELATMPRLNVTHQQMDIIAKSVGSWNFSANHFSDEELVYAALLMLKHVLKDPELAAWRIPDDDLLKFLMVTRKAYNPSVIYHNFRHACDVLQAVFHFLVSNGVIPPLLGESPDVTPVSCPLASLIRPVHALTLLIAAIGHDVGHPGVNNVFLVKVKAAVAQVYNDHSVLESYHCAASSQILRRFWPAAFSDVAMRKMMISSILATDMTLHSQYTARLDQIRKQYGQGGKHLEDEDDKTLEEHRELLCCLIIKCADICNVARRFDIARDWAVLVTQEFAHQGSMETEADIPSCLFGGPPDPADLQDMAKRQIGFMSIFAYDLFAKITDVLPGMQFTVDNIQQNKSFWQRILDNHNDSSSGQPFDTPSDGRQERRDSVRPAQPQEVPNHDFQSQNAYPVQPQTSRPSQPLEVPQEEEDSAHRTSSGSTSCARGERPETHHRRSSTRSSITSSTQKGKDSVPRRFSGMPTTQAAQLAQQSKEPRRGSLGNIAPPKSKDGSPRRSSGRSSPVAIVSHPAVQDLPGIFNSALRVNASVNSIALGDAADDREPAYNLESSHLESSPPPTGTNLDDLDSQVIYSSTGSSNNNHNSPTGGLSATRNVNPFKGGLPSPDSSDSNYLGTSPSGIGTASSSGIPALSTDQCRSSQWPSCSTAGGAVSASEHTDSPEDGKFENTYSSATQTSYVEQRYQRSSTGTNPIPATHIEVPTATDDTSDIPVSRENEYSHHSQVDRGRESNPPNLPTGGDTIAAPGSTPLPLAPHQLPSIQGAGDGANDDRNRNRSPARLPVGAHAVRIRRSLRHTAIGFLRAVTTRRRRRASYL